MNQTAKFNKSDAAQWVLTHAEEMTAYANAELAAYNAETEFPLAEPDWYFWVAYNHSGMVGIGFQLREQCTAFTWLNKGEPFTVRQHNGQARAKLNTNLRGTFSLDCQKTKELLIKAAHTAGKRAY